MKGLFRKEKKVTYKTIRQKIKDYNKREYEEFKKSTINEDETCFFFFLF